VNAFLITVDTEGDNLWSRPGSVTTENAAHLPRFQALCESYGFKPTYLTNWEMAHDPVFQEFARDILVRGTGEIGMHLHAWDSPPLAPLTADDTFHQPYLIEYPEEVLGEKVRVLTAWLEESFRTKMLSHRAGRWAMDERYARVLVENGYHVDCSVTPHLSWRDHPGDPAGRGGADYTRFPARAYFMDLDDIARPGDSSLLEVPLTVIPYRYPAAIGKTRHLLEKHPFGARVARRLWPEATRLVGTEREQRLLRTVEVARREKYPYVEFAIHSSEVMPGGSPTFPDRESIERLYRKLERVFDAARETFAGATLAEYAGRVAGSATLVV